MIKVLVTGASGLVGSRFVELYKNKYSLFTPSHTEFDITQPNTITSDVIINFSAYTNVSEAEKQRDDPSAPAWQVNVEGVRHLLSSPAFFIHISSDMVCSGSPDHPGPYSEDQPSETEPAKLNWYGYTKAEGERLVDTSRYAIVRLINPVRANFAKRLDYLRLPLQKFDEGQLYPLFTDQQISITFIDEACLALQKIVDNQLTGIFHASSPDITTPHEIISYNLKQARNFTRDLATSSLAEFLKTSTPARYPLFGGLKVGQTQFKLGMKFSTCHQIVDQLIAQTAKP